MAERIYTRAERGRIEPLEEKPFSTEDELQALIAEHPELLDGEQIRPGDPRRWILISREQGIAETSDAAARWAIDHLIIDQDAVPTLAEVKRGSNPEIRRPDLDGGRATPDVREVNQRKGTRSQPRAGNPATGRRRSGCGSLLAGRVHEPCREASPSAVCSGRYT